MAWTETTTDDLVALIGLPGERAAGKGRDHLLEVGRAWLGASPLCVVATADAAETDSEGRY